MHDRFSTNVGPLGLMSYQQCTGQAEINELVNLCLEFVLLLFVILAG